LNGKAFSSFLNFWRRRIPMMKSFYLVNVARVIALAFVLGCAPFALQALAQNSGTSGTTTTTTQSAPAPAQSSSQSTTQTTKATETNGATNNATGINPLYLIIGGVVLLAIILIALLASRGRSGGSSTHTSRTVVKKE
jgi:hypothetical protein